MTREEAIKILREAHDNALFSVRTALETLIPELKESEDEKIRRELIDFIQWAEGRGYIPSRFHQAKRPSEWINYLEKQKENTWSEEDDEKVKVMCKEGDLKPSERAWLKDLRNRVWKEQKPAEIDEYEIIKKHITHDSLSSEVNKRLKECGWYITEEPAEWSEEDEEIWFTLITFFKGYLQKYPPLCKAEETQANRILNWLNTRVKSFRLHHRYKPTEDQMKALKNISYGFYQNGDGPALRELYEQLEKLM